ncbi:hypothetical protein QAD02_008035 [Eretmocerus hayati]|uniref:Uncharacterized protein n=1 Tax=Eretmocerus hayati TaxID=131215 RepID=A0ACC2N5Y4_9HYME|nr:hypothetical protein QAD02_008035 [Eretmocerus hayati]
MDPGLAIGHEATATLTKWQLYNFFEVRKTTKIVDENKKVKFHSKTVAGRCGVCGKVLKGHSADNMQTHRKNCRQGNRAPLADVCVNRPQEAVFQATASLQPREQVVSTIETMISQAGTSPQPTPGLMPVSPLQPILPQPISTQPSSRSSSSSHTISAQPTQVQSSPRLQPYSRPQSNANAARRRSREKKASNDDDRNVKLLKFAIRHQIDFSELDCDIFRCFLESLDAKYAVPPSEELKSKILDQAIAELRDLQSTYKYRPYIIVSSQGAGSTKQVFSFAMSNGGNYVYVDSIKMPCGDDASATLEKFCDDSVLLARERFKIKKVPYLMHEGVGALKDKGLDNDSTYL